MILLALDGYLFRASIPAEFLSPQPSEKKNAKYLESTEGTRPIQKEITDCLKSLFFLELDWT